MKLREQGSARVMGLAMGVEFAEESCELLTREQVKHRVDSEHS